MIDRYDYEYVNFITCPYCGHEDRDSWEEHMNDGDHIKTKCQSCWKEFRVRCYISVKYTSKPLEKK